MSAAKAKSKNAKGAIKPSTPGEITLQWLSYAIWSWLSMALIWLSVLVLTMVIKGGDFDSELIPYAFAAGIVLLPTAVLVDMFYRRHEPAKKVGIAAVVMVVHAVLFALVAVGTLIGAVFVLLSMLLSLTADMSGQVVATLSLLIAAVLFVALLLRVLRPQALNWLPRGYMIGMIVISVGLLAWALAGPLAQAVIHRQDLRIERNISDVNEAIKNHVYTDKALPSSFEEIRGDIYNEDALALIDDKLISYHQVSFPQAYRKSNAKLRYELCATYDNASKPTVKATKGKNQDTGYKNYLDPTPHKKGNVCYKLYATAE